MYSRLSSLGKGIGSRRGFTPLALALNTTSASSTCAHRNIKVSHFALSAIMHQIPSELPLAYSPKVDHGQEIKPAFRNVTSAELPKTFADKFIKMLKEAAVHVTLPGQKVLKEVLREIPPMALSLTAQGLVLEHLEELPTNMPKAEGENEEDLYRKIRYIANDNFQKLLEVKSFEHAVGVAIKQSPELLGESDLYQIIFELVRAGLLWYSTSIKEMDMSMSSGPLNDREIQSAQFGANGERGQISLSTGIITRIIECPKENFSPFLRNLLKHNDVATLEGNIYEYICSRRTILSGLTPAMARTTLLKKGVYVIPASAMNMEKATNRCHQLHKEMAKIMGPRKSLYTTNLDLHLTIQAHLQGRSLVTNDQRFLMDWEYIFHEDGIHVHWLKAMIIFEEMKV
ncbi:hypothetical protein L211DRAFT_851261 [Terfezia boudieri ATCC MYA-4762]|uniref:Uncharacterized protein n=1 Tax=Terfezia boudieri ATCC MYA-4762 TaxID=1051890 RepID=A0A3N4LK11_9PEZI|nr:hypothetical protein L211DRAFT_851261 [Terfezia boudieri ATCC MYA-4762]